MSKNICVLDKGFVRLVDHMGDDAAIVQAARVSYGAGTKTPSSDRDLIRYMMRSRHTSPFESCEFKFHIRVPMDTWRQWIRHRTASVSEYSTRYSEAIEDTATTEPGAWRLQSGNNKQGSKGFLPIDDGGAMCGQVLSEEEAYLHKLSRRVYQHRLEAGVAREQARKDLSLSTYTEAYWKIDLHNLLHFLSLRLDEHAQWEIRQYARAVLNLIEPIVPVTVEAFRDYRLHAMTLTAAEVAGIYSRLTGNAVIAPVMSEREVKEFEVKAEKLGIKIEVNDA